MEISKTPIMMGNDHAAQALKLILKDYLTKNFDMPVEDAGAYSEESVDYPDYGQKVALAVSKGTYERGILLCGTGLGMSMVANKYPHVRAALCNDLFSAIMSRQHNNANILVLGARVIGDELAKAIVKAWLETPFEGGRHQKRLDKFDTIS